MSGVRERLAAEPLVGNELEDGAGGADPDALAAPGASRVIGIAVAADDDLGVLPAQANVEHADLLDVLAGAHAAGAQDAGAHVVLDHHVAGPLVSGAERQLVMGADRHVVLDDVALELVAGMSPAAVLQVLARIALQQEVAARCAGSPRPRRTPTSTTMPSVAGVAQAGMQLVLALDRHQADPAVAHDRQLRVPAERGDLDSRAAGGLENRLAGLKGNGFAVQGNSGHERPVREEVSHSSLDGKDGGARG